MDAVMIVLPVSAAMIVGVWLRLISKSNWVIFLGPGVIVVAALFLYSIIVGGLYDPMSVLENLRITFLCILGSGAADLLYSVWESITMK